MYFSRNALFHIKTRVFLKYFVRDCSYDWTEAVVRQCSQKMMFCKTSQSSQKSICDGVPFGKNVSPPVCNCPKKDAITGVFLRIALVNKIFFGSFHSSICSDMFYKVGLLKNFEKLTGKHLCRSFFFLMKLHTIKPATLLKRDFSADVLLWILQNS